MLLAEGGKHRAGPEVGVDGELEQTYIHQHKTRRRLPSLQAPTWMKGPRRAARVHEELVHILEGIKAVGAAPAEDVDVQAVSFGEKQVWLARDEGEALEETDADAAMLDDVCDGEGCCLDVLAAADDLEIGADGAEVLIGVLVGEIAEAEGLRDLSWGEELLKLERRQIAHLRFRVSHMFALVWHRALLLSGSIVSAVAAFHCE